MRVSNGRCRSGGRRLPGNHPPIAPPKWPLILPESGLTTPHTSRGRGAAFCQARGLRSRHRLRCPGSSERSARRGGRHRPRRPGRPSRRWPTQLRATTRRRCRNLRMPTPHQQLGLASRSCHASARNAQSHTRHQRERWFYGYEKPLCRVATPIGALRAGRGLRESQGPVGSYEQAAKRLMSYATTAANNADLQALLREGA